MVQLLLQLDSSDTDGTLVSRQEKPCLACCSYRTVSQELHSHPLTGACGLQAGALTMTQPGASHAQKLQVCGMAEALAKALEHRLLLTLLAPEPEAGGEGVEGDDDVNNGGVTARSGRDDGGESTQGGVQGFRYRVTPGYELLPAARAKATGLDPKGRPAAAAIIASDFPRAVSACEAALSKAGTAQVGSLHHNMLLFLGPAQCLLL